LWIASLGLPWRVGSRWAALAGAAAGGVLLATAVWAQRFGLGRDLGAQLWGSAADIGLRLGLAALSLGLLLTSAGGARAARARSVEPRSRRAWLAVVFLLAGAVLLDHGRLAGVAIIVGFALAASWAAENGALERIGSSAIAVLLAALASAGAWEAAHRDALRDAAPQLLHDLAPPTAADEAALGDQIRAAL